MNEEEHPKIADTDWRVQGVTVTIKESRLKNGRIVPEGARVELAGFAKSGKNQPPYGFALPNAISLYLSIALKSGKKGNEYIRNDLNQFLAPKRSSVGTNHIKWELTSGLYDAFENLMICVVFSFSAIELFANSSIPNDYIYKISREGGKCTEVYNKSQIERWIGIEEKLTVVLPEVLNTTSPKGSGPWSNFIYLKRLRNKLIHLKSDEWRKNQNINNVDDAIWTALLSKRTVLSPNYAFKIIEHYYPDGLKERWMKKYKSLLVE